jgi:lipopolysaccharide export system permease protein
MNTLDRYIARLYIFNVVALFVLLAAFVVGVDVTINLGRFSRIAEQILLADGVSDPGVLQRAGTTAYLVLDLWWPRLLQLFGFLNGIVLVGAMGFTCSQLVRNRELIAVMASGLSLQRVARSIVLVAIGFTTLQALNQELLLPKIAPLLSRTHREAGQQTIGSLRLDQTRDGQDRLWYARVFDPAQETLEGLRVVVRDSSQRAVETIVAESATWDDTDPAGGAWILTQGTVTPRGVGGVPVAITRVETSLDPTSLRMASSRGYRNALSFRQVGEMLSRPDLLDRDERERLVRIQWGRVSMTLSNLLTLIIALPFFLTMASVCFYFQVHQPYRPQALLRSSTTTPSTSGHRQETRSSTPRSARRSPTSATAPMTQLHARPRRTPTRATSAARTPSRAPRSTSSRVHAPTSSSSFQRLAETGCCEFLGETYYHSLSFLYSRRRVPRAGRHAHRQAHRGPLRQTPNRLPQHRADLFQRGRPRRQPA